MIGIDKKRLNSLIDSLKLKTALGLLNSYNWMAHQPIDEDENPELSNGIVEYLSRDFGENYSKDKAIEKMIAATAYKSVIDKWYLPRSKAESIAKRAIHSLRESRIDYLFMNGKISKEKWFKYKTENVTINFIAVIGVTKKVFQSKGVKFVLSTALVATGIFAAAEAAVIAGASLIVWTFLPKKYKEQIKGNIKVLAKTSVTAIVNIAKQVSEKVKPIAQKVVKTIENTYENARAGVIKVAESITTSIKEGVKAVGQSGINMFKKIFA